LVGQESPIFLFDNFLVDVVPHFLVEALLGDFDFLEGVLGNELRGEAVPAGDDEERGVEEVTGEQPAPVRVGGEGDQLEDGLC
jgi:hypothetical protein